MMTELEPELKKGAARKRRQRRDRTPGRQVGDAPGLEPMENEPANFAAAELERRTAKKKSARKNGTCQN
jgi:hypothetical protein